MRLTELLQRNYANWKWYPWMRNYENRRSPISYKPAIRNLKYTRPVRRHHIGSLFSHLDKEYQVMQYLSSPYLTKEEEEAYFKAVGGNPAELKAKEAQLVEQTRMPGKAKALTGWYRRYENVGNLLHSPRTIEDHLKCITDHRRYE